MLVICSVYRKVWYCAWNITGELLVCSNVFQNAFVPTYYVGVKCVFNPNSQLKTNYKYNNGPLRCMSSYLNSYSHFFFKREMIFFFIQWRTCCSDLYVWFDFRLVIKNWYFLFIVGIMTCTMVDIFKANFLNSIFCNLWL